jgi:hypothetical protein
MNESRACTICQHETAQMACVKCERRMHRQLREILDYVALAETNLVPGQGVGGRGTERPIGIRVDALDLVAGFDVLPQLESWERLFREDYKLAKYGQISGQRARVVMVTMPAHDGRSIPPQIAISGYISGTVTFLQQWLPRICADHAAVDEFAHELRQLHRQAQAASGQSPRTSWNVACPSDTDDGECGNRLKVNGEDFDGHVTCRQCKTTWPVQRLLLVAASSTTSAIMLDPEAAARMYNVSTKTLQRWAKDGRIHKEHGRYDVRQIQQALAP